MKKTLLTEIKPHVKLYRDEHSGIAWVEDGTSGTGHSCHPNIDASGSVRGMKNRGFWGYRDQTVKSHGFIYNVDQVIVSDDLDRIAARHCQCAGCCRRKEYKP